MTTIRRLSVYSSLVVLLVTTLSFTLNGSLNYRSQSLSIAIEGTSSLHDWTIKSDKGKCDLALVMTNDKPTGISALNFSIPVETLKSGKGAMDKNTYNALKSGDFKNITYTLSSGTVTPIDAVTYQIKTIGKLTIAGSARLIDLYAVAKYNAADRSFTISGSEKLKMTDYGVKPPEVMFGTIKTGNDITVSFNSKMIN